MERLSYATDGDTNGRMILRDAVTQYLSERRRNQTLRTESQVTVKYHLYDFQKWCGDERDVDDVTRQDIIDWLAALTNSVATKRNKRSSVRGLYRWLLIRELVTKDPTFGVDLPASPKSVPRAIAHDDVTAIFEACADSRERLIVSLMVQEGLRAGEVSRLELADIDLDNRMMLVKGKGGHERMLPITLPTVNAVRVYLCDWPPSRAGRLIRSKRDLGRSPIARDWVSKMMSDLMTRAGIKHRAFDGVTGHALRHTAASDVLDAGNSIKDVQEFLGHSSITTTQIYLRRTSPRKLRGVIEGRDYSKRQGREYRKPA